MEKYSPELYRYLEIEAQSKILSQDTEHSVVFLHGEGAPQPVFSSSGAAQVPTASVRCSHPPQLLHCKEQSNKANCGVINVIIKLASGGVSMKSKALTSSSLPLSHARPGRCFSQINSCESAAGPVMSFPLYPASLFAAMPVLHWDVVVVDWGFFMTGGFDLGLQSESLHGKWIPSQRCHFLTRCSLQMRFCRV